MHWRPVLSPSLLGISVYCALFHFTASQGNGASGNRFINPPASNSADNPIWRIGERQTISWKTTVEKCNISFWQQNPKLEKAENGGSIFSTTSGANKAPTNFIWTVQTYAFDLNYSNVFFLWFNPGEPGGFTSNYFNISSDSIPASSTATEHASSTTPSGSSMTSTQPHIQPTTDEKIRIGAGVGGGIGGLLLILAASALTWWILKRPKQQDAPMQRGPVKVESLSATDQDHDMEESFPRRYPGFELHDGASDNSHVQELPAERD
ncbi:hypothetical protein PRK78_001983 [Emydomyces testavorans]|uniref:Mid2 domain-containing protein n=1 Tax=Emydomyces testavorans TaxID=2070801 RepID=A0AAF0DDL6_9EURO|nr:hypothetical protein PRK78_001983 [Emydomyces testavorans]